jgi:dihydropteroate synthase
VKRTPQVWRCRDVVLRVSERTHVVGILNVTPDSFSDGGRYTDLDAAVSRGAEMAAGGADVIDVGGESTRPGAEPVAEAEELRRVIPVIEALVREVPVPISIDTAKAGVAQAALDAGAVIVNDVTALRGDRRMAEVVATSKAGVVLMHMLGDPRTMQKDPRYGDVVADVGASLLAWAKGAEASGVEWERIVIDPGIGFGKNLEHNLLLLRNLGSLTVLGYPVLVGPSRKSFIHAALGLPHGERLEATAGAVAWAVAQGAQLVRVHDVTEMVRVVRMTEAIRDAGASFEDEFEPPPGRDKVIVRGLRVFGYHGVHAHEQERGQDFVIDLEAHLDLRPAGRGDDLDETLDYSDLARRASAIVSSERFNLIEALAERLAAEVLEDPRVARTVIRVAKPAALAARNVETVLVEIERER